MDFRKGYVFKEEGLSSEEETVKSFSWDAWDLFRANKIQKNWWISDKRTVLLKSQIIVYDSHTYNFHYLWLI